MADTATFKGSFEIRSDSNPTVKKLFEESVTITELLQTKQKIAPSQTDEQINFGGVTTAKVVYIETDQQITVKINDNTNVGFKIDKFMALRGEITALYVTTGVSETTVQVVLAE